MKINFTLEELDSEIKVFRNDLKRYFIDHEGVEYKVTRHTYDNDINILEFKFGWALRRIKHLIEWKNRQKKGGL